MLQETELCVPANPTVARTKDPCEQPPAMPQVNSLHMPLMPVFSSRAHMVLKEKTETSCPEKLH